MAAVLAVPDAQAFQQWAKTAPWTGPTPPSTRQQLLVHNAQGQKRAVRWRWQPQAPVVEMDAETRKQASVDFLSQELQQRLANGPVRWNLVTTAEPGDAIDDPSVPWPESRDQVVAGVLSVDRMQSQEQGACGQINSIR